MRMASFVYRILLWCWMCVRVCQSVSTEWACKLYDLLNGNSVRTSRNLRNILSQKKERNTRTHIITKYMSFWKMPVKNWAQRIQTRLYIYINVDWFNTAQSGYFTRFSSPLINQIIHNVCMCINFNSSYSFHLTHYGGLENCRRFFSQ